MTTSSPVRFVRLAWIALATSSAACEAQADPNYSGEPLATLRGAVTGMTPSEPAAVGTLWFQDSPGLGCAGPVSDCDLQLFGADTGLPDIWCMNDCDDARDSCDEASIDALVACLADCGYEVEEVIVTPTWSLCASGAVGESVPVTGAFPAHFTLALFDPPPASALLQSSATAPRGALALIVAQPADAEQVDIVFDSHETWNLLGGAESQLLFYAADPIAADSDWGQLVGGPLDVGYHVLEMVPPQVVCTPVGDDTDDEVCVTGQFTLRPSADGLDTEIDLRLAPLHELELPLLTR